MEQPHRILVVCEETELLEQIGRLLIGAGFETRCTSSAAEAMDCFKKWPAALVITQYQLGEMLGLELAKSLHQINLSTRFILITTANETPDYRSATRNRIVAFLTKPFNDDDLLHYVHGAFGKEPQRPTRRQHQRYFFQLETQLVLVNPFDDSESRPLATLMNDVSQSGVSVIVRQMMPVPAIVKLVMRLPNRSTPLPILAKTVSCTMTQMPGVYRLGAKFMGEIPADLTETITVIGEGQSLKSGSDVYIGKSFQEAVGNWLTKHNQDAIVSRTGGKIEELATELAANPIEQRLGQAEEALNA